MPLTDKQLDRLTQLLDDTGGKAWEPRDIGRAVKTELCASAIAAGFLQVVDGRFFFEKMPNSMIRFTEAGKLALSVRREMASASKETD